MNLRFDGKIPFTFKRNKDRKQKAKCSFSENQVHNTAKFRSAFHLLSFWNFL